MAKRKKSRRTNKNTDEIAENPPCETWPGIRYAMLGLALFVNALWITLLVFSILYVRVLASVHAQVGFFFGALFLTPAFLIFLVNVLNPSNDMKYIRIQRTDISRWSGVIIISSLLLWAMTAFYASIESYLPAEVGYVLFIIMFISIIRLMFWLMKRGLDGREKA